MIEFSKPTIFWITGLSGAGKSTLGSWLASELNQVSTKCIYLDGDELRSIYSEHATDKTTRLELGYRNLRLCALLANQGFCVVISAIGMQHQLFSFFKGMPIKTCLVYIDVPISELKARDPKGIYKNATSGKLINVAGLDYAVDQPLADIHIKWHQGMGIKETKSHLESNLVEFGFFIS